MDCKSCQHEIPNGDKNCNEARCICVCGDYK